MRENFQAKKKEQISKVGINSCDGIDKEKKHQKLWDILSKGEIDNEMKMEK